MEKKILPLMIAMLVVLFCSSSQLTYAAGTATVPLNITVNGALVITDASNDTGTGRDPTINVNLNVTPDLSVSTVTGQANFRIRTNQTSWKLTAQRTQANTGSTMIDDGDVSVVIAKAAGSRGNANAGRIVAPFNNTADLSKIPTAQSVDVISGSTTTSSAKDGTNRNNYFQVNTTYGIAPDFFYTPGTYSTTITYNLVSP